MAKINNELVSLPDGREVLLRSPSLKDADKFLNYCTNIFSTSEFVVTYADEFRADLDSQKAWIGKFENQPGAICIIAEYDGQIIGNIDFHNRPERRKILHRGEFGMGVIKEWRGRGLGKILVSRLIQWARQGKNPIEKIELMVLEKNMPAIRLYKSLGFKEEGRVEGQVKMSDGAYVDGLSMGLWVAGRE